MKKIILLLVLFQILEGCSKSNDSQNDPIADLPPDSFSVIIDEIADRSAKIVWTASKDPENKTVAYEIYLNDQLMDSQIATFSFVFEELSPEITYSGKVVASDGINSTTMSFSFTTGVLVPVAYVGNVLLTTQQEVIDFGKNRYSSIEGSLKIGKFDNSQPKSDIDNLSSLNDLKSVSGSIDIYSTPLETLEGLNNLVSIGVSLTIFNNSSLLDLDALESLETVTELLSVGQSAALSNLNGLSNLKQVEHIIVYDCDDLQNLNGLQNVGSILNNLGIIKNDMLTDITALSHITSVEYLFIEENRSLENVEGLNNLTRVAIDLRIVDNPKLIDLRALGKLSTIGDPEISNGSNTFGLLIFGNPLLIDFDGLQSLVRISGGLYIGHNVNLLNFKGLNNLVEITHDFWFYQNDSLEHIDDLENLKSIHRDLRIYNNFSITNLDGLSTLGRIGSAIQITDNTILSSVCGLQNVLINYEYSASVNIYIAQNAFDLNGGVTRQDIIDGNCSV